MKNFVRTILTCMLFLASPAWAQGSSVAEADSMVPPTGPLEFYGQTLDPYHDYYTNPGEKGYEFNKKYDGFTWDNLRHLIPELFPEYKSKTMSASELCDMMVRADLLYLNDKEIMARGLVSYLLPHFPDLSRELEFMDEIDRLLYSKDSETIKEFIKYLDGDVQKAMAAKDFALKSLAVSILRDAAIHNCPARAKAQRYVAYVGPYPSENENGDIVWMDGTVIWQKNN